MDQRQREARVFLPATYSLRVSNTGNVDSDEVVQVYFVPVHFTQPRDSPIPKRQLIDFQRVHVKAGATVEVPFTVAVAQLELVSADGTRAAMAGNYAIEFTNGENATARAAVEIR